MSWNNKMNLRNFVLKLVANTALVVILVMIFSDAAFGEALVTGLVLSIVAYLLGDLGVLPRTNNITATVSDAILAGLVLWGAQAAFGWDLTATEIIVTALLLGVVEYIFHIRLIRTSDQGNAGDKSILS